MVELNQEGIENIEPQVTSEVNHNGVGNVQDQVEIPQVVNPLPSLREYAVPPTVVQ